MIKRANENTGNHPHHGPLLLAPLQLLVTVTLDMWMKKITGSLEVGPGKGVEGTCLTSQRCYQDKRFDLGFEKKPTFLYFCPQLKTGNAITDFLGVSPWKLPSSLAHSHRERDSLHVHCLSRLQTEWWGERRSVFGVYQVTGQHLRQFPASQCKSSHTDRKAVGLLSNLSAHCSSPLLWQSHALWGCSLGALAGNQPTWL